MKKRIFVFSSVALLLAVAFVCLVDKEDSSESDRFARNVESLSLPPEDEPKDFDEKYEYIRPVSVKVTKPDGTTEDSTLCYVHLRNCSGIGYLKCEDTFDTHSKDKPQECPWD